MEPEYLGDAVYAQATKGGAIYLTTDSHLLHEAGNQIVLEPETLAALLQYVERLKTTPRRITDERATDT